MFDSREIILYHNPRCSKSRQTLQLLHERNIEPRVIEYLKMPPSAAELDTLLNMLGLEPRQLMRTGEQAYTDIVLNRSELSRSALIEIMVAYPILIERPILIRNGRAAIGRPPETVLELF